MLYTENDTALACYIFDNHEPIGSKSLQSLSYHKLI